MSVVDTHGRREALAQRRGRSTLVWRLTVASGMALLVLAGLHIVANHFLVNTTGGLRDYRRVLEYIANPVILVLEALFLLAVTVHAMLGVRSVLYDLDLTRHARRRVDRLVSLAGALTVAYGLILLAILAVRAS